MSNTLEVGRVRNSAPHLNHKPTDVYRCWDAAGRLLYIGATHDLLARLRNHRTSSDWFPLVANVTAETHPDRMTALHAELTAIEAERPAMNRIVGPPQPLPPVVRTPAAEKAPAESGAA